MGLPKFDFKHVISNNTPLLKEPDPESEIMYFMRENETVIVDSKGSTDNYYMITVNGLVGYVLKDLVK
jgi:hypothetical protein